MFVSLPKWRIINDTVYDRQVCPNTCMHPWKLTCIRENLPLVPLPSGIQLKQEQCLEYFNMLCIHQTETLTEVAQAMRNLVARMRTNRPPRGHRPKLTTGAGGNSRERWIHESEYKKNHGCELPNETFHTVLSVLMEKTSSLDSSDILWVRHAMIAWQTPGRSALEGREKESFAF